MSTASGSKACLFSVDDPGERLQFLFNPTEYSVSKQASWNRPTTRGAPKTSSPEFAGTHPASVQMEVLFDHWETSGGDVSQDVKKLFDWLKPTRKSLANETPEPPVLAFDWGQSQALSWFRGYLRSVNARYTMVWGDGTPTRATASISLEEVPTNPEGQNPTSGGVAGRRAHVTTAGDSLHSVAYREYGDASRWRALADLNGIDDPLRVPAGTTLVIATGHDLALLPVPER
jgi:Contractile injection system tube protein